MNRCSPLSATHQLCLEKQAIDNTVFPFGCLWISLHAICLHTDTTSLPYSFCVFHRTCFASEVWTSNIISLLTPPIHVSHICLLTLSWAETQNLALCVLNETWSWSVVSFIISFIQLLFRHRHWWPRGAEKRCCSSTHAVLTISTSSTLSFVSGALTNILHQFLMHSHMVVLFFFRYCAK